jgi:hypothetical protein
MTRVTLHTLAVCALYLLAIVFVAMWLAAVSGCGPVPSTMEQARECREACREAGLPVLRMRDEGIVYGNGQIAWRCECGEVRR